MASENHIEDFRKWALKLGCPLEKLPSNEFLKVIFRSNQSQNIAGMTNRILPRNEIVHIRDNIINKKVKKIDRNLNTHVQSSLPKAIQRYVKIENLKLKVESAKKLLNQTQFQIQNILNSIETENRNLIDKKENLDISVQRIYATETKHYSFDKYLVIMREKQTNLGDIFNCTKLMGDINCDYDQYVESEKDLINNCVEYLFDKNIHRNDQTIINNLKLKMNNIKSISKWNLINNLSNDQINTIKSLSEKPKIKNKQTESFRYTILLAKLHASHIKIKLNLKKLNSSCIESNECYEQLFENFFKILITKFELFNSSMTTNSYENTNISEFISSYIESFITKCIFLDEIKFLNLKIDMLNNEIKQNGNFSMENKNYNSIYGNILQGLENIKRNSVKIVCTKEKIVYLKKVIDTLANEIYRNTNKNTNNPENFRKMLVNEKNLTTTVMESFYDDSVFCSTKIGGDFDNISRLETTIVSSNQNNQYSYVQSQLAEYQLFVKSSFSRNLYLPYSLFVSTECHQLNLNKITNEIIKKIHSNHLYTCNGILECLTRKIQICDSLKCFTSNRIDFHITFDEQFKVKIDEVEVRNKLQKHKENLAFYFNQVDGAVFNINKRNQANQSIINHFIENGFKKYISGTLLINGHSYKQFENELLMYNRIINSQVN